MRLSHDLEICWTLDKNLWDILKKFFECKETYLLANQINVTLRFKFHFQLEGECFADCKKKIYLTSQFYGEQCKNFGVNPYSCYWKL